MSTFFAYNNILVGNGNRVLGKRSDPYNPLNLPSHTIRVKFKQGYPLSDAGDSRTLVDAEQNIWDIYKDSGSIYHPWNAWDLFGRGDGGFDGPFSVLEVLGANTTGIQSFSGMFTYCYYMTKVALFDTSSAYSTDNMFDECTGLTEIPNYDLSNVVHCSEMFSRSRISVFPEFDLPNLESAQYMFFMCSRMVEPPILRTSNKLTNITGMFDYCSGLKRMPNICTDSITSCSQAFSSCNNIESGILDMYNRLSANGIAADNHKQTFFDCGKDTTTGAAELAQIPADWKT